MLSKRSIVRNQWQHYGWHGSQLKTLISVALKHLSYFTNNFSFLCFIILIVDDIGEKDLDKINLFSYFIERGDP